MTYINPILTYIHDLPGYYIYFFLGLSAFVENLIPPIPGDTITVFGAFLVGSGRLSFIGVYTSTTLGSLLGFLCLFRAGGYLGSRFFLKKDHLFFSRDNIKSAENWLRRYGYFIILINRFLPGIRSVISITSGILGLKAPKVIFFSLISCAIWNMICIYLGYILGNNWDMVRARISFIFARYNLAILILFIALILFLIIKKKLDR
jgi:membrane protein DedA with SNARE-associated domain